MQGTLVDMGFSQVQVDAAIRHFGPRQSDMGQLIMWMVANPTAQKPAEEAPTQAHDL